MMPLSSHPNTLHEACVFTRVFTDYAINSALCSLSDSNLKIEFESPLILSPLSLFSNFTRDELVFIQAFRFRQNADKTLQIGSMLRFEVATVPKILKKHVTLQSTTSLHILLIMVHVGRFKKVVLSMIMLAFVYKHHREASIQ